MFHSVAGMGAALLAVIVAAIGIHNFENGAILIAGILVMVFFMFYGGEKDKDTEGSHVRLIYWGIVIVGDLLAIAQLVQRYIIK